MKNRTNITLFVISIVCLVWSTFATVFTLSGSVERNAMGAGKLAYVASLMKLMFGWQIVGISIFAWAGLLALIFLLAKYFKRKK